MKIRSWIALLLLAGSGFSIYYVYDSVTSIDYLVKSTLNIDSAQFGLLYSFYSVANVFFLTLLVAGFLVDIWGYPITGLLFVSLCLIGSALTALGASFELLPTSIESWLSNSFLQGYSGNFKVVLLGRMIFGIGSEALFVVILKALSIWFGKKHVAFSFAAALVLYRFGTFLTLNLQVKIAQKTDLSTAMWFACFIMFMGWLSFIVYLFVDRYFKPELENQTDKSNTFKAKDISSFPISFWYLTLVCITFYGAITSFEIFDPAILRNSFHLGAKQSGFLASTIMIATMVFMPILGWIIDKSGKRATFLIIGSALSIVSIGLFLYVPMPVFLIILLGLAYSLIATAIWATVPIVVEKKCQGTAFGILGYIQNVGLMLFPWLSGYIVDLYTNTIKERQIINYQPLILFLALTMAACLIFSILLKLYDRQSVDEGASSVEDFKDVSDEI